MAISQKIFAWSKDLSLAKIERPENFIKKAKKWRTNLDEKKTRSGLKFCLN